MSNTTRSRSASPRSPQFLRAKRLGNSKVEMWSRPPASNNLSPAVPRSPGRLEKLRPHPVLCRWPLQSQQHQPAQQQYRAQRHHLGLRRPGRFHQDQPPRRDRLSRQSRAKGPTIHPHPPAPPLRQSSRHVMARGWVRAKRPPSQSNPADSGKEGSFPGNRRPRRLTRTSKSFVKKIRRPVLLAGRRNKFRFPGVLRLIAEEAHVSRDARVGHIQGAAANTHVDRHGTCEQIVHDARR